MSELNVQASTKALEIQIGHRRLQINAGLVLNGAGEPIGTVVECSDVTSDRAIQSEFARIIDAAQHGDFDQQIALDGVHGVYEELGSGMNQLTSMVANMTDELAVMLEAIASGDLNRRITSNFRGRLGELRDHANRTADQLTRIVREIQGSTKEVQNAAAEIASGTEDLSQDGAGSVQSGGDRRLDRGDGGHSQAECQ